MRSGVLAQLAEALGAGLVVLGLVFWSLPFALVTAGCFLVIVANAPGAGRPDVPPLSRRGGPRAEAKR